MQRSSWLGAWLGAAAAAAAMAQDGPCCRLTTITGKVATGTLAVAADGGVRVAPEQGEALTAAMADVLSIEVVRPTPATAPAALFVWLRSGSAFPATRLDGTEPADGKPATVRFTTPAGAGFAVPLAAVAAIRCRDAEPKTFAADRAAPDLNLDYLFVVKDGAPQRFSVTIASIHGGKVHFDLRGTAYDYALTGADGTAALVFGRNTGFAPDRRGKPHVLVELAGGECLEGQLLRLDAELRLQLDEGAEVAVPAARLRRIDVRSDKLAWLSALQPAVEQTPAFDRTWPWTRDSSPAGPGIQLGGKTYARGLVMVPRTRLTYDLGGRFDVFEAVLGIDDRGGPQAHAILRVLVDGKVAFESEPLVRGSKPKPVRVELGKCRQLAIEADFGKNFDLGDLCAFADARVLQQ